MYSILKLVYFLWRTGWGILNPNLNPMRNAPFYAKYFATVMLGFLWSLAFGIYTAQFFFIGISMLAHMFVISMVFLTWLTFKGFRRAYPDTYPLMRDPNFSPKCYEMTEDERLKAVSNADLLLEKQSSKKIDK